METPICRICQWNPALASLTQEDVLDLNLAPVTKPDADDQIDDTEVHLRIGTYSTEMPFEMLNGEGIPIQAFEKLFLQASNMHFSGNYLTGLQIHFGIDDNSIFPVFQPVYMPKISGIEYSVKGGLHYVYDTTTEDFEIARESEFRKIVEYKEQIKIQHYGETSRTPFRNGSDVESVIFPFQTIYTLIVENQEDNDNTNRVHFHNSIRKKTPSGVDTIQHGVLLSTFLVTKEGPFTGQFANRSHLCPPDKFSADISRLGPTFCP